MNTCKKKFLCDLISDLSLVKTQNLSSGGLAQLVECALCKREAPGSKPGFSTSSWSYSVMVITLDFESSDPGSNPGRTFFCLVFQLCVCDRQSDYAHRKSINQNKFRSRRLN